MVPRLLAFALLLLDVVTPCQGTAPPAQDKPEPDRIVLRNGNEITGKLESLVAGKVTFQSPVLGKLTVPLEQIRTLETTAPVTVLTEKHERYQRRIRGITDGRLELETPEPNSAALAVPLAELTAINLDEGVHWSGALTVGATFVDGNTRRRNAATALDLERRTLDDRFTVGASWNYAEERDPTVGGFVLTERRTAGALKYDYFVSKKLYLLATTSAENDFRADLRLRYTAGGGLGYQWVDRDDLKFATEAGLSYFYEDHRSGTTDDYIAARAAWRLDWEIITGLRFLNSVDAFPSLERGADFFAKVDTRLKATLLASMFAQLQWQMDYDNTPAPGRKRMDNRYILAVGWNF